MTRYKNQLIAGIAGLAAGSVIAFVLILLLKSSTAEFMHQRLAPLIFMPFLLGALVAVQTIMLLKKILDKKENQSRWIQSAVNKE